ncbi:MAG: glycosyltransferase [Gammaproteobacteria bacterium]
MPDSLSLLTICAFTSVMMWVGLLLLPWRPWSTRERIDADPSARSTNQPDVDLADVTVLIPARDEASCIEQTLAALKNQGGFASIILIDDQSDDGTKATAEKFAKDHEMSQLHIIDGQSPPPGWSGKLWALNQGLAHVHTPNVLLLDADIALADNMALTLLSKLKAENLDSVSVMASLYMGSWAEKLLLPPFIYFFKIIYPFHLANSKNSRLAAAAGGCVLMKTERLRDIGGFEALKSAIIDDCTLAKKIKNNGGSIWIGLSRDVRAIRPYESLSNIWNMVARTAYTQLHYSVFLLLVCTTLMLLGYVSPFLAMLFGNGFAKIFGALAFCLLCLSYIPTIRYYELPLWWSTTLPLAGAMFLAMTWTSAFRYARGERSRWKNRSYQRDPDK